MRLSKLIGRRIKEVPRDAQTTSHIFLIRGGYVRSLATGIYSLLPLGKRISDKIEKIVREEMNSVEGQESLMPVVMPADIWRETGRYDSVGPELLRFKDRNSKDMVLGMTHEEAFTAIARTEITSYKQLPCMLYQIQTKYRDEARPRAGLIRVREFTMKDGYSFHEDDECLQTYYKRVHQAYERIFARIGLENVISIEADSGMMGGAISHEFMAVCDCGEDVLFLSPDGKYRANREIAVAEYNFEKDPMRELEEIHTPEAKTIADIAELMNDELKDHGKVVIYSDSDKNIYFVMIRGDFEVNESKLKKFIGRADIDLATDEEIVAVGSVPGYASPIGLDLDSVRVIFDHSAAESSNLTVGANRDGYHYKNFNFERDLDSEKVDVTDIATVRDGDKCQVTGLPLEEKRGIEVGNIFQLGTKYSEAMGATFLDKNGKSKALAMGCYGIGIGRSLASVIESSNDKFGPIWPISIAPYHLHICALNYTKKEEIRELADKFYNELQSVGIEVLLDDRNEKPGFMFNDADLIGIPHRIVISPRNLKENLVEYKSRNGERVESMDIDSAIAKTIELVKADLAKYS